ncbi:hypothetical protein O181_070202 [Austropuccinia psidii MF-1]|uniref:DH domain-containing protein n=1 Tax=Austropuccinia psidii MF-1 TaxID=1389203 RepID=A0A9Q3I815_9BASI|nr:hypothetical protein [Austropuccinia psidii MF-1]
MNNHHPHPSSNHHHPLTSSSASISTTPANSIHHFNPHHHPHLSTSTFQSSRSSATTLNTNSSASFLQRQTSTISIDMPIATASVVNKTASRSASLYQNCLEARALMRRVPGFEQGPWINLDQSTNLSNDLSIEPPTPRTSQPNLISNPLDPVSQTLDIIRLGSSLCYLYNAILLEPITPPDTNNLPPLPPGKTWKTIKPLQVVWCPREDLKGCQKSAAHFIMAVKTELGWGTEIDESQGNGLMVNMLYDQNTNATVKVISNVLRLLHLLKALGVLLPPNEDDLAPYNNDSDQVLDDRARVVKEILESERKYVQDLEVLQNYQRALLQREILPSDQIRALFMNLDSLVDFQRRFLIGVEANARLPPDDQRFGHLFTTLEDLFSCYEPFCANFASASQLAQDENAALMQVADILDPNYELPTFLIKPVQRICKYPLLLQQLVKHSNPNGPYYDELREGLASIARVTDGVNETTRQRENELAVNDLKERVEDWKGHDLTTFGQLVLEDTFTVVKNESEREYHVYLFERIILCCKEVGSKLDKKASKQSMSLKKSSQINNSHLSGAKRKNTQQLKGRIFIANVMSATPRPTPPGSHNHYLLQVTWRGDISEEYFSIKCRTEEQLKKWQAAITKAVDDAVERRRRQVHHLSSGSRSKLNSPLSQFPNTPQSEMGTPHPSGFPPQLPSHHPRILEHPYANSGHGNGGGSVSSRTFEDEEESYHTDAESSTNGRNTPSGSRRMNGHRSMPAERSEMPYGPGRARAQTDDASSVNFAQWRSHAPTSMPPLPRSGQITPASSDAHLAGSLRSSTSSRHLRHKQSQDWPTSNGTSNNVSGLYRIDDEHRSHPSSMAPYRYASNNGPPPSLSSANGIGVLMSRSRSASSPNIHQPIDAITPWASSQGRDGVPSVPSLPVSQQTHRGLPVPNPNRNSHTKHRSTDSSAGAGTDRSSMESRRISNGARQINGPSTSQSTNSHVSGASKQRYSSGQMTMMPPPSSSSMAAPRISNNNNHQLIATNGNENPNHNNLNSTNNNNSVSLNSENQIRFKLKAGEDTYVIVTNFNVTYFELLDKIFKKLKNCGVMKESSKKIKIRYEDEEGDLILICNDEDLNMAIEWMKNVESNHLLLFVD